MFVNLLNNSLPVLIPNSKQVLYEVFLNTIIFPSVCTSKYGTLFFYTCLKFIKSYHKKGNSAKANKKFLLAFV